MNNFDTPLPDTPLTEASSRNGSPQLDGIFISSFEKKLKDSSGSSRGLVSPAKNYALSVKQGTTRREAVLVSAKPSPNKISTDLYQVFEKDDIRLQNLILSEKLAASSSSTQPRSNVQFAAPSTPMALARSLESELDSAEIERLPLNSVSSSSGSASTSAYAAFLEAHSPRRTTPTSKDPSPASQLGGLPAFYESVEVKPSSSVAQLKPPIPTAHVGITLRSKPSRRGNTSRKSGASQSSSEKFKRFMQLIRVCMSLVLLMCCLFGPLVIGNKLWQQWSQPPTAVGKPLLKSSVAVVTSMLTSKGGSTSATTSTTRISVSRPFSRIIGTIQARKRHAERLQRVLDILGSPSMLEQYEVSGQRGALSPSIPFQAIRYLMGSGSKQTGAGVADWSW